MKRTVLFLCVSVMLLSACGSVDNASSKKSRKTFTSLTQSPVISIDSSSADKYYSTDEKELLIDMSRYSDKARLLTGDDIYLSGGSTYRLFDGDKRLIVSTQEQLDYLSHEYGFEMETPEFYTGGCEGEFIDCDIESYDYIIEYTEHSTGGYHYDLGALLVDTDELRFVFTEDSHFPGDTEEVTEAFTYFMFVAAVPKGTLMNDNYDGWEYPEGKVPVIYNDVVTENGISYIRDQLMISVLPDTDPAEIELICKKYDADLIQSVELTGDYLIQLRQSRSYQELTELADTIKNDGNPNIISVSLNYYEEWDYDDNDENGSDKWNEEAEERSGGTAYTPLEVPQGKVMTDRQRYMEEGELIAMIKSGSGEYMLETDVYKLDDGWYYVNYECTTKSYGSPDWNRMIKSSGKVNFLDDVLKESEKFGSMGFVVYPDDRKNTHTIDEFCEEYLMN